MPIRSHFRAAIACLVLACVTSSAWAWGTKEHVVLTRLAVLRVMEDPTTPAGLKDFLRSITPELADRDAAKDIFLNTRFGAEPKGLIGLWFWVVEPDIRANNDRKTLIQPFGVPERTMHFVDLELLHEDIEKRVYKHDLSTRLDIANAPADSTDARYRQAGYLPFAIRQSYDRLVQSIKDGRLMPDENRPKDDDHALRWLGFLVHYAQDNCQPQHATADYKSQSYFANRRAAPNVHSEVEWRMNDDEIELFPELRKDYWQALLAAMEKQPADPFAKVNDVWKETLMVADLSYQQLPLIGLAAMHATGQAGTPDKPVGDAGRFDTEKFFHFEGKRDDKPITVLQMKAEQQALSVARTASLIRRAWDQAQVAK
jgi:hypothetical protein